MTAGDPPADDAAPHFLRPKAEVLPPSAAIPEANQLQPAPNQFTHLVEAEQPFFYRQGHKGAAPDGMLPAGAKVVLMRRDGASWCHVADARGLYVVTAFSGLRPLA